MVRADTVPAHVRGTKGSRGARPIRPCADAVLTCARLFKEGPGSCGLSSLRAATALPVSDAGGSYWTTAPGSIRATAALPGPVWACWVRYHARLAHSPVRPLKPTSNRNWQLPPRPKPRKDWPLRPVRLSVWVGRSVRRRELVELAGLGWMLGEPATVPVVPSEVAPVASVQPGAPGSDATPPATPS